MQTEDYECIVLYYHIEIKKLVSFDLNHIYFSIDFSIHRLHRHHIAKM